MGIHFCLNQMLNMVFELLLEEMSYYTIIKTLVSEVLIYLLLTLMMSFQNRCSSFVALLRSLRTLQKKKMNTLVLEKGSNSKHSPPGSFHYHHYH